MESLDLCVSVDTRSTVGPRTPTPTSHLTPFLSLTSLNDRFSPQTHGDLNSGFEDCEGKDSRSEVDDCLRMSGRYGVHLINEETLSTGLVKRKRTGG